jgi:uncharacterized protein (TIGR00106 family)
MLVQLAMFPTSKADPDASVSADVAEVIDIIDRSGLPYKLGPMSTVIEGEWDEIMPVINKARLMLKEKHQRIYIVMTIDDRKGAANRITGKITAVEKKLGREVRK